MLLYGASRKYKWHLFVRRGIATRSIYEMWLSFFTASVVQCSRIAFPFVLETMEAYDYVVSHCVSPCVSHLNAYDYCDALHAMRFPDDWMQPPWNDFDEWRRIQRCWFTADELVEGHGKRLAQQEKDELLLSELMQNKEYQRCAKRKKVQIVRSSGQARKVKMPKFTSW